MSIEQLADALDDGMGEGVFEAADGERGSRCRSARTWLFLLGYLRRDNEKSSLDDALRDALARLRADLGLDAERTGLDTLTFSMLARLVSFEPDCAPADRFAGVDLRSPALRRAVGLRLYALDLLPRLPDGPDDGAIDEGLARFVLLRTLLDMPALEPPSGAASVAALFDLDALLTRLRAEDQQLSIRHPPGASFARRRAHRDLVSQYVQALARIELWLIGYLTRPRRHMAATDAINRSLPHALRQFWRDQPPAVRPPARQLEDLDGHFFRRVHLLVAETTAAGEGVLDSADDEAIVAQLLSDADLARAVRGATRSLGARLLDGARRALRFVVGWIKRGLTGLAALARNLARVVNGRVNEVFGALREVFLALPQAWRFLTRQPLEGSLPEHLVMRTDADFDFVLVMRADADPLRVIQVGQRVVGVARLFAALTALLDRVASAFLRIGRRLAFAGWFGALLALLQARAWLADVTVLIEQVRQARLAASAVAR